MKKKILTILTGAMLTASVSFAAPITDVQQGQTNIGYNHYNLDISGQNVDADAFYLEGAVSDKVILGIERNSYSGTIEDDTTDVYAQYKLDPNVRLILGSRDYNDMSSKVFYGIGATTNLAANLDGYASVTKSSVATEWQTGLNYKVSEQATLNLGYKSYKHDGLPTLDGVGFGLGYKF